MRHMHRLDPRHRDDVLGPSFWSSDRPLRVDLPPTGSAFGQGLLVVARECGIADTSQRAQPARRVTSGGPYFLLVHCLPAFLDVVEAVVLEITQMPKGPLANALLEKAATLKQTRVREVATFMTGSLRCQSLQADVAGGFSTSRRPTEPFFSWRRQPQGRPMTTRKRVHPNHAQDP